MGLALPAAVIPPGLEVTVYWVIAAPPLFAGAVNDTVASPFPRVAVPIVGAPGTVSGAVGVTGFDVADASPVPAPLVAVTIREAGHGDRACRAGGGLAAVGRGGGVGGGHRVPGDGGATVAGRRG